jgi:hypothetical protein
MKKHMKNEKERQVTDGRGRGGVGGDGKEPNQMTARKPAPLYYINTF